MSAGVWIAWAVLTLANAVAWFASRRNLQQTRRLIFALRPAQLDEPMASAAEVIAATPLPQSPISRCWLRDDEAVTLAKALEVNGLLVSPEAGDDR